MACNRCLDGKEKSQIQIKKNDRTISNKFGFNMGLRGLHCINRGPTLNAKCLQISDLTGKD